MENDESQIDELASHISAMSYLALREFAQQLADIHADYLRPEGSVTKDTVAEWLANWAQNHCEDPSP